jgi:hypothetical protein
MTGTLGFMAAAEAVRMLGDVHPNTPYRWRRMAMPGVLSSQ